MQLFVSLNCVVEISDEKEISKEEIFNQIILGLKAGVFTSQDIEIYNEIEETKEIGV